MSILIPPGDSEELRQILDRIRVGEHIESYETVRLSKFGQLLQMSLTISPIRDAQGRIVAASTIGRDITERKQAERALQQERELLRAVIDNIPDLIYVKDRKVGFSL